MSPSLANIYINSSWDFIYSSWDFIYSSWDFIYSSWVAMSPNTERGQGDK